MAKVRQVLLDEINTWERWYSGAAADHALWAELRRTGHDQDEDGSSFDVARAVDDVGMQALTALATEGKIQCSEKPGNWGNLYAPLGVSRAAERGPGEPKPPRTKTAKKGKAQPKKAPKPAKKVTKTRPATAPTPTKPVSEAKAKILARVPLEAWKEGLDSVLGLISKNDTTRGAWLLLHARPSVTVAAEVLDLLVVAGLVEAGDCIRLGAPIKADLEAQPGARLSYLLTRRLGAWVCQQIASYRKPPTADVLAKTGVPRGLWCVLTNALEEEGRLCRSKGGGVPVWAVTAQGRTDPLFEGIEPAPAREEAAE